MLPRKSYLQIEIDGADITKDFEDYVLNFTYTDRASGESDTIDLTLHDRDGKFIDSWYPMQAAESESQSGSSDYNEMAQKLQQGCSSAELQRLIDASDLTPEQGAELQRLTSQSVWPQFSADNPQYRGLQGKLLLIHDIKGVPMGQAAKSGAPALTIKSKICVENWEKDGDSGFLDTGKFKIDSCELSGPPDRFNIKAVSIPVTSSLKREEKTNTWEEVTLEKVAKSIADKNGMALIYEAEGDINLDRVDQTQQTDMSFLLDLCTQYGISLKATDEKIVLFEEYAYEQRDVVDAYDKSEAGNRILDYSFRQDINDTVSKAELHYKDPKSGLVVNGEFIPPNPPATGQKLILNDRPGDLRGDNFRNGVDAGSGSAGGTFDTGMHPFNDITADFSAPRTESAVSDNANRICKARCRAKNKNEWTCDLKLLGNRNLFGGVTIDLTGFGKYSGKYMVDTATHKTGGGYETSVKAHKVLEY